MEYYRALNQRMDNRDPEIIEKIVREHHNMNLPGEDVYVFNQPTK
jgi:(2Fe-2S) ferredoxin